MTDLFTHLRDTASRPWTKPYHLGKCSNGKIAYFNFHGTLRSTADFASALTNVKGNLMQI